MGKVMRQLEEGGLTKQTTKRTLLALQALIKKRDTGSLKVIALLQKEIPAELLETHVAESAARTSGPREVILSEYLQGK